MRVSTLILCLVLFSQGCWKVEETTRTSSTTLIRNNKIINNEINDHIDKLVEFEWSPYESAGIAVSRIHPHAQYLAKCSPDIIPVLIKHIDDMRPTNVENVTVGDVIAGSNLTAGWYAYAATSTNTNTGTFRIFQVDTQNTIISRAECNGQLCILI